MCDAPDDYVVAWKTEDPDELRRLAAHSDRFVLCRVASNRHAPIDVLTGLISKSTEASVLASIVDNPSATSEMLGSIYALLSKNILGSHLIEVALAANSKTPVHILQNLFRLGHWGVYSALMNNDSCPDDVLEAIANLPVLKTHNLTDANAVVRNAAKARLAKRRSS